MLRPLKYARAFQNNGPDYFVVSGGEWRAEPVAICGKEEDARFVVLGYRLADELIRGESRGGDGEWLQRCIDLAREILEQVEGVPYVSP